MGDPPSKINFLNGFYNCFLNCKYLGLCINFNFWGVIFRCLFLNRRLNLLKDIECSSACTPVWEGRCYQLLSRWHVASVQDRQLLALSTSKFNEKQEMGSAAFLKKPWLPVLLCSREHPSVRGFWTWLWI